MEQVKNTITDIIKEKDDYIIKGKLQHLTQNVEKLKLILIDENEKASFLRLVDFEAVNEATLTYQAVLNINHIDSELRKHNIELSSHSFYLHITFADGEKPLVLAVTVRAPDTKSLFYTHFKKTYGLTLRYFSFRCDNKGILKLVGHLYNKEDASYLSERAPLYGYMGNKISREKIILFGGHSPLEGTFNTWSFFCYLRKNYPEIKAYYILDETAPGYEKAVHEEDDGILIFRSKNYINKILTASLLITDKNPETFYPSGTTAFEKYINAKHWLLPATPFGMTNEKYVLEEGEAENKFSKIFMNSRSELRFIRDSFNMNQDKMELTGLPAPSYLMQHNEDSPEERVLFILPQMDLPHIASVNTEKAPFISLLEKENFQEFLTENKLSTIVALPDNMKVEKELLEKFGCMVVRDHDEEIIKNLQKASLLLTDYHPHALTYSVLNRAIIFYHRRYRPNIGEDFYFESYQNELPGDIVTNEEDLMYLLNQYAENNFNMKVPFVKKKNLLFEYQDGSVYERIFEHLEEK